MSAADRAAHSAADRAARSKATEPRSGQSKATEPIRDVGPLVGVLALQGDVREHVAALESLGARAIPVRRVAELEAVDALVLPGGESTAIVKLAEAFDVLDPLRARIRGGMPTFGSCAGMILLADRISDGIEGQPTIGGLDVLVRRNAFGRQVDSFETDVRFAGVDGGPVHAVFIRAPWVEAVGGDVEVLAAVEGGPADGRIVAVRAGHLLATSFHPELTGDLRVHRFFLETVVGAGAAVPAPASVPKEA